jgi:ABC-type Zn uptake system ZnuABC Zn-binding protein ZnuA
VDLAAIGREIGGDRIAIESIARGYQDPHFVEAKPSFILKLQKADLLVVVGRELEIGWLPPLIQQSRNAKVQVGADGYIDASAGARILEIPQGQVTRAMGDVHPQGNPHYWLDPENARAITAAILERLARLRPEERAVFAANRDRFLARLEAGLARWKRALAPHRGTRAVVVHESWPYFAERFGLVIVAAMEPTPGVPPTPATLAELEQRMKAAGVRLIIAEPWSDASLVRQVAGRTGARVAVLVPSVGADPAALDYLALFDLNVKRLAAALASP